MPKGLSLRISQGALVLSDGPGFDVSGQMLAPGTADAPVYLTGTAASQPGAWRGIVAQPGSTVKLSFVHIEGGSIQELASTAGAVTHVQLLSSNFKDTSVNASASPITVQQSTFTRSPVFINGGSRPVVTNNSFVNTDNALQVLNVDDVSGFKGNGATGTAAQ
ncbi:MAG: hypothetical protein M3290_11075, partial [Actinomycetota bacterium]|nr:hypothetical protein [Actinomycetota bacterium]